MASKAERKFNTFVKGIITEAGALTFPENASLDEDNLILNTDGSRQRRLGMEYEIDHILTNTGFSNAILRQANVQFFRWDGPAGDTDISIGIVRIYNKLWFINLLNTSPSSALLNDGEAFPVIGLGNKDVEVTPINNLLVMVGAELNQTLVFTYQRATGFVYLEEVPLFVRDIWGVDDGLDPAERPSTLSPEHNYNLINQGWNDNITVTGETTVTVERPVRPQNTSGTSSYDSYNPVPDVGVQSITRYVTGWVFPPTITTKVTGNAIQATKTLTGKYPSNSDLWTLGKESDSTSDDYQKYNAKLMIRNSVDNVYAPKASMILDAYNRGSSRRNSTGLQTLPLDKEANRCTTVTSYASRVFYSGITGNASNVDIRSPNYSSYIFFTQVVLNKEKISLCYQDADPTSPDINDIIDTDGGSIQIPEVTHIVKLVSALGSLLVFAENGIWEVYGDSGGFTATSFQLSKVSSTGVTNPKSVIEIDGSVFAWTDSGIYLISSDQVTARFKAESLSLTTIQDYYDSIPKIARDNAKVVYTRQNNRIRWMYNDTAAYGTATGLHKFNKELILDLTLKSFYPSTIHYDEALNMPFVYAYVPMPDYVVSFIEDEVVVDNEVVQVGGADVFVPQPDYSVQSSDYKYLTIQNESFTLSSYRNPSFYDWATYQGDVGYDYDSFLVTGYDIAGDFLREKWSPYIEVFMTKTESGFTEASGVLTPIGESSCMLQAQWQWHNTATGNKWSTARQAYRLPRAYTPANAEDTFDTGSSVVVSRNKLRGSGKSLSLKFSSETGKEMKLLGWGYQFTAPKSL